MSSSEVLIIGAGPTGLVLALWLSKLGIRVRIIDKTTEPGTTSRALAIQARTLELYRQLDLTDEIIAHAHKVPAVNLWVKGASAARIAFDDAGIGTTPYPSLHIFPQDRHERLLIERLQRFGIVVERTTELMDFAQSETGVAARLRHADGSEESCSADFIAGCDGAHSVVRRQLGIGYPGGTYRQLFYVADVQAGGPASNGELHIDLDQADFLAVFPLGNDGRVRLIGTVRDERAEHPENLTFDDVSARAIEHLKLGVEQVNWFSTYRVHHRVSDHFRADRAFLLGDAAHIHSPAGGQGMNTGIGDAINLAWKFAAVLRQRAPLALLDSYEAERIGFARRLVATTDRVFRFATAEGGVATWLRMHLAPLVIPGVAGIGGARELLFRTVGQLNLEYRHGPLSIGHVGTVQGGDRLPWVQTDGEDNSASLVEPHWQVHVYGEPSTELEAGCSALGLPLHRFAWHAEHERAGLIQHATYLLRPDGYIAVADPSGDLQCIEDFASRHGLALGTATDAMTAA